MKGIRIAILTVSLASAAIAGRHMQEPMLAAPQASGHAAANAGADSYAQRCAICHGDKREGILPDFPPLIGIQHRMNNAQLTEIVHKGKGRMPGFPDVQDGELAALTHYLLAAEPATPTPASTATAAAPAKGKESSDLAEAGGELFHQNCAFCHGRDAMGGESGPDLTESKLVRTDATGAKIAAVIREGRPENKMPAFNFSATEVRSIIAFIHAREAAAAAHPGGRRGVAAADLQTGNAEAGKKYFEGAGGCVKCHSASGDLAGIASRLQGLQLEQQMLYPRNATRTVTVTLPSGASFAGTLAYLDEFTVALRGTDGVYRSWAASRVTFKVDSPVDAHVEQFGKYTDEDIHNLMAYLQTMH